MNITETTYGIYGIHSRKLDAAALPQDFTDRMLTAAFHLAWLIGNGEVTASDDGNAEAEDALDTLSGLAEEAMQRFGTPCAARKSGPFRPYSLTKFCASHAN